MKKYMGYAACAALALGVVMLIAAVICFSSARTAMGSIEDTYYYLGMNLHHGRFTPSDARDVIGMLKDIGIADAVVTAGQVFAVGARIPLLIIGILLAAAGGFGVLRGGVKIPENTVGIIAAVYDKVCAAVCAAYRWVCAQIRGRRCPACGERLTKDAVFCGNCGAGIEAAGKCPGCGTVNEPDARYCNLCGRPIK